MRTRCGVFIEGVWVAERMIAADKIPNLPLDIDFKTNRIMRKLVEASASLAELKGFTYSVPNQGIFLQTLRLQEAKDSSEIENIVTTNDEIFKSAVQAVGTVTPAAKEV